MIGRIIKKHTFRPKNDFADNGIVVSSMLIVKYPLLPKNNFADNDSVDIFLSLRALCGLCG